MQRRRGMPGHSSATLSGSGAEPGVRTSAPLCLRLFGPFSLSRGDLPLPAPRTRKGHWLLALLLLRHGQAVDRSWLASTLWPDSLEASARDNLRTCLKDLRHLLEADAWRMVAPTPRTLTFEVTEVECDLLAFDAAIARGNIASLETALSLYRGELLEGCDAPWIFLERETRAQAALTALETLSDDAVLRQSPERAVAYLRHLVTIDPLRENAWQRLMRAYADLGDRAAVAAAYREMGLQFARALNIRPSSATIDLYRQLCVSSTQRPEGMLPRPKLADSSDIVSPGALPRPANTIIGRATEIETVHQLLKTSPLVTLIGAGGVGKTRLLIAVAETLFPEFADGVFFIDLAPLTDPGRVVRVVADGLGVPLTPNRLPSETIGKYLVGRSVLLLLDNCEHVSDECARLASALISRCPKLRILATSRRPLGSPDERTWRVPSLSLPEGDVPVWMADKGAAALLMGSEAVRLFAERASAVSPSFRLGLDNLIPVASICRQVDGIPLAIELAAAWIRVLPLERILALLQERPDLLQQSIKGAHPSRQQTMRATVEWSYSLLEAEEQRLLRSLTVFVGGWTLEAATAITGEEAPSTKTIDPVLLHLATLTDHSLVLYEEQRGVGWYRMAETTRQCIRERLSEAESYELARRHAAFYLQQALLHQEMARQSFNPNNSGRAFPRMELDQENYLSAWHWWQQEDEETGLVMMQALQTCAAIPSGSSELSAWVEKWATAARPEPSSFQAGLYLTAYEWARWTLDSRWRSLLQTAYELSAGCDDPYILGSILHSLGFHEAFEEENAAVGQQHLEAAMESYRRGGYVLRTALVQEHLAHLARLRGDTREASRIADAMLQAGRAVGSETIICLALKTMGELAFRQENYSAARHCYTEILRHAGPEQATEQTTALRMLGRIAARQGDLPLSEDLLRRSIATAESRRNWPIVAWGLEALAQTARQAGNYRAAMKHLRQAIRIAYSLVEGINWNILFWLFVLGQFAQDQGDGTCAAILWGFRVQALQERGWTDHPDDRIAFERSIEALKASMPADALKHAWSWGSGMTPDEVIAYALEDSLDTYAGLPPRR